MRGIRVFVTVSRVFFAVKLAAQGLALVVDRATHG
jgi:hypothetical protein